MGCFGHPTSWLCLALYPVPPTPAILPGHYSKLALNAGSLPLFTSPQLGPGSLVACSTWLSLTATCVPPWLHPSTSSHCWQEWGSTLWCSLPAWNTHQALLNGPLKPPLSGSGWNWTREHPKPLPSLGGGQDLQHSPAALPLMTTVGLWLAVATVPLSREQGMYIVKEVSKMRPTCHPHFKTRFTLFNMFLVTPSHAFSSHENVLIE